MAPTRIRPTNEERARVERWASLGIAQREIARAVRGGIDPRILRRHFSDELYAGATEANARVAESLFNQAVEGHVSAAIFWCKSRMGWGERAATTEPLSRFVLIGEPEAADAQKWLNRYAPSSDRPEVTDGE